MMEKSLTVAELIEELQKLPPNLPVFFEGDNYWVHAAWVQEDFEWTDFKGPAVLMD